jgi:hypothetical protein
MTSILFALVLLQTVPVLMALEGAVFFGAGLGAIVTGLAGVEFAAARWPASWRRDALAGLATLVVATALSFCLQAQAIYYTGLLQTGSFAGALGEMGPFLDHVRERPAHYIDENASLGVIFVACAIARLRGIRLWRQMGVCLIANVLETVVLNGFAAQKSDWASDLISDVVAAVIFPAIFRLSDAIDARIARRLAARKSS